MKVIYDHAWNANEWAVILSLSVMFLLMWITPKVLNFLEGTTFFLYGLYWGIFYDHTLSVPPWDFYDVNDVSSYQWMDFLSYVSYGPFSYFFIYLYAALKIRGFYQHTAYVLGWVTISIIIERVSVYVGLFHYDKGFNMAWSVPVYLVAQTTEILLYRIYLNRNDRQKTVDER